MDKKIESIDKINHPSHYTQGGIECIKAIEAALGKSGFEAYCKGNAIKYIWRENFKNGSEDIQKAITYLNFLLESRKTPISKMDIEQLR